MENPYASDALKGMRAVVCGASKGIGRATAEMLAACGADVIALSRSAPDIAGVRAISLDLEDAAAIEKTIAGILAAGPLSRVFVILRFEYYTIFSGLSSTFSRALRF